MPLFWFVLLPVLIGSINYFVTHKWSKYFILVLQVMLLAFAIHNFAIVKTNGPISIILGNYAKGIGIQLYCDNIAAVLVVFNILIFTCMGIFSISKKYMTSLFTLLFLLLQGLLNGIFLSNDLFNLYVLIELSTIVVSILIMFKKDRLSIYDGMVYLLINIAAMSFFLIGIGYIYKIFGILDISLIKEKMSLISNPRALILPYSFLMTAICLKSAIFPLFSWLPKAHGTPSAPSIVSAILSGLYIKGGLYLFIRIQDMFSPQLSTQPLFLFLGFITGIIGFILALSQTDIKRILAYSTVSQIGLIVFGISLSSWESNFGSIYHILNHGLFKALLFLIAGLLIDAFQTRDIRKMYNVYEKLPFISIISFIAIMGITGAPLFNGSISKYYLAKNTSGYLEYGIFLINLGTITIFIRFFEMFFRKKPLTEDYDIENTVVAKPLLLHQKAVLILLAALCLLGGIFGSQLVQFLFGAGLYISKEDYFAKSLIYLVSVLISFVFYRYIYSKISLFKKIRELEFSFPTLCLSLFLFFSALLAYLHFTV